MSAIPAFIRLIPWQALRVPATGIPTSPVIPVEELIKETDATSLDDDPADPSPKRDPKKEPDKDPKPDPKKEPRPPFEQDETTCQLRPPAKETLKKLKTQAVIAANCEQAMRDAYNRGYRTGRAVSKTWKSPKTFRCQRIKADGQYLGNRLKRIILQQENGPRKRIKVSSRHGGGVLDDLLDAASS